VTVPLLACLVVLLALGAAERAARDRAWRDVPIRIHVNGTRGKSTVTRLVWAALNEARIPTVAKTTGTAPRILLPDGREEPFRRRSPANVREQLAFVRLARRTGARALVVECMAIDPVLQAITERDMVRATIGVITNVRSDHEEAMGAEPAAIAGSLAGTIPTGGVLVTGAIDVLPLLRERAARLGTRVVTVAPRPGDGEAWLAEDRALALAVTRELGILDDTARRGFERAPPDPGTVSRGAADVQAGRIVWTDASAANDPESLSGLVPGPGSAPLVLIYHHRDDRSARLATFARRSPEFRAADRVVVTGPAPPWTIRRRLARLDRPIPIELVAPAALPAWIRSHAAGARLVFCGNTRGLDVTRLLEEAASRD
jgi:gamma-polyglutamate synthase